MKLITNKLEDNTLELRQLQDFDVKEYIIPEKYLYDNQELPITYISDAFKGNKMITKIHIPSTVRKIKQTAFYDCVNLKTVTIDVDESESFPEIQHSAFMGCPLLKSIKFIIIRRNNNN